MAENIENNGYSQRDNAEHEGYVKASRSFNRIWKERDSAQPRLLEAILYKDNFNRAYKRVKANKGAPGIDGMTIEEALPYLKEHQQEITDRIYRGKYTPSSVRRVEIPKPDDVNGWLYHRIRMCIWKQWKLPRTKKRNLIKMGIHEYYANMAANCRRGHWYCANLTTVKKAMTKERLINSGFYDLATAYQSVHVNY